MPTAIDLLINDLAKLFQLVIGYVGGWLIATYQKNDFNFGVKNWQKAIIYIEVVACCFFVAFKGSFKMPPRSVEQFVLLVLPCLIGVMIVVDKKEERPTG